MSLKSKIEAVIYASEEPVTLVQLVGLLGEEAQAELDALAAQQQALALEEVGDADAAPVPPDLQEGEESSPSAEGSEASPEESVAAAGPEAETVASEEPQAEATEASTEPVAEEPATEEPAAEEPSAGAAAPPVDEKKLAAENKVRERKLREYFRFLLDQLIADYANGDRGLEVREVAGGFRMATKPEYHDAVRGFIKSLKPPLKLSLQALETLAVVAYKQPITAPEVSEIRGVDSGGVLGSLLTRKLIQTAGRKQVIGRPMLYKTSKEFLVRFGLKDINELPSIEEFEKMASELNDAVQEEIPMEETAVQASGEETVEAAPEQEEATASTPTESPDGVPPAIDELNAVPEPTHAIHESVEDILSDDSIAPEGSQREHDDPSEVEPMAEVHEAQADGTPDGSASPTTDQE